MQKVYLVSFADTRLGISACRFKQEAEEMNIFEDIFIYSECSLPLVFKEKFRDKFYVDSKNGEVFHYNTGYSKKLNGLSYSRGFGYWCWKPKVILMALEQIKEGDLLVFLDIGMEFCASKREELIEMLEKTNQKEIVGLQFDEAEKKWQKGDTLAYFDLTNNEEFLNSGQFGSGMIFLKKSKKTFKIISEWMEIFDKHYDFVTDEPSKLPNKKEFVRNSHDQAIWSILIKKYKGASFPRTFYYERADNAHALLVRRNKIYLPSNAKETNFFNNQVLKGGKRGAHNTSHIYTFVNEYQELKARAELKIKERNPKPQNSISRIHSHLAYKLGQALILNSKSLWGYIRMPYVLSYIKEAHKKEIADYQAKIAKNPKLKLPPLESYADYK
ncbi:hypothetical protein, partial [uncultured Helicobacter sp.]|uniref:hypothetical protein n=1 Tax=uncultured Helicobacter sp. TaxID=175537 RepID=UPI002622142C